MCSFPKRDSSKLQGAGLGLPQFQMTGSQALRQKPSPYGEDRDREGAVSVASTAAAPSRAEYRKRASPNPMGPPAAQASLSNVNLPPPHSPLLDYNYKARSVLRHV